MKDLVNYRNLQLFAQEGAAPESGVTEADAQPQSEPSAGSPEEFEKLIQGPYRQAYDQRVQGIVQQRLKKSKETVEAFQTVEPMLREMCKHYGVEEGNYSALDAAVRQALAPPDPAEQQRQREAVRAGAMRLVDTWQREAQSIREVYPGFDLRKEMENPGFSQLLRAKVDLQTAYEIVHKDEIIPAAMAYAARRVERKLAENLRSSGARPAENGTQSTGAVQLGSRVAQLSRKEIADLCRRVERGEKVSFD